MKKTLILSCIVFVISNCTKQYNQDNDFEQKIHLVGKIELSNKIDSFILDFMKSLNNPDCIYELYIDKQTEDKYRLTLFNFPIDTNYFASHFPVNYTIINDKMVFIYSGIEDFIRKDNYYPVPKIINKGLKDDTYYEAISMEIKQDTSFYVKNPGISPFSKIEIISTIYFEPPEE